MIEYLQSENKPGLLFFADFAKAFDSLNHKFMLECIKSMNFGSDIQNWISLFYNDIQSLIINNGHLSESFRLEKGVRQGCPLSSTLFILSLQTLTNYIAKNNDIKGIKINDKTIKQTFFADDSTFFNDGNKKSFETLINTLQIFSKCSGLNLNINKSIVLRVGTLKNSTIRFCKDKKFIWTSDCANTLGMNFTNDTERNISDNIQKKICEFKNTLKQWQHRKLTLMGKITVIKTFALPKLIYPFTVLSNPNQHIINDIKNQYFLSYGMENLIK